MACDTYILVGLQTVFQSIQSIRYDYPAFDNHRYNILQSTRYRSPEHIKDMERKLLQYCKILTEKKNIKSVIKDLITIFNDVGLINEQANLLRIMFHLTKNNNCLIKAGDMYVWGMDNADVGYTLYDLYLQRTNPQFYERYKYTINNMSNNRFPYTFDTTDYHLEIINLTDRYNAIAGIILYFNQYHMIDEIISAKFFLNIINNKIKNYTSLNKDIKYPYKEELNNINNMLAQALSFNENNITVNEFAITLDKTQEQAYLNLINAYISDKKYDKALEIYNNYCLNNNKNIAETISSMLWATSDMYAKRNMVYRAIKYQQYASEYDLEKSGGNNA